jgi:hypothetical protein
MKPTSSDHRPLPTFKIGTSQRLLSSSSHQCAISPFQMQAWAFNADISRWDVSAGLDFGHMFDGAAAFRQDLRWVHPSYRGIVR